MSVPSASPHLGPGAPSGASVHAFAATLSSRYRRTFEPATVAEHAAVAAARGSSPVSVGRFRPGADYGPGICVVAKDRPGLLAAISAALVAVGLDVIRGEAHTRAASARGREAVDLFWVRSTGDGTEPERVADSILEALAYQLEQILSRRRPARDTLPPPVPGGSGDTRVRFVEDADRQLSVLEVEADDRPGLLLALASALRDQKVRIDSCQVDTRAGRAQDRFTLQELDGTAITDRRRLAIQVAVLSVVDAPRD